MLYSSAMSWITRLHRLLLLPSSTGISRYLTSTFHNIKCWYCHRQLSLPVDTVTCICPCENHVILPPTTTNYFTIMQWYVHHYDIIIFLLLVRHHSRLIQVSLKNVIINYKYYYILINIVRNLL